MVTYEHITWKVTLLGNMFEGAEEWSTGFFMGSTAGGDMGSGPTTADAEAVATAWQPFFTGATYGFHERYKTLGVKISLVSTNGTANPGNTVFYYYPTQIQGGVNTGCMPGQVSLAATLTTARVRGYGSKGRMFLPGLARLVGTDGRIGNGDAVVIRDGFKTFVNAVNDNIVGAAEVVVNSALSAGIPGHPALVEKVTGVRVGNVYDTQRRRRNQLVEVYQSAPLV